MKHRSSYSHECLAGSGLAVMNPAIACRLRPDLWGSVSDCARTLGNGKDVEGVHRMMAAMPSYGEVLVLARSLDNLQKRIEWIVGCPVLTLRQAEPEGAPAPQPDLLRRAAAAKEVERQEQIHQLAAEEPPGHDCERRREILAARAELGS